MSDRTYMYHDEHGAKIFNDDELEGLEAEGWVDTPAKLKDAKEEAVSETTEKIEEGDSKGGVLGGIKDKFFGKPEDKVEEKTTYDGDLEILSKANELLNGEGLSVASLCRSLEKDGRKNKDREEVDPEFEKVLKYHEGTLAKQGNEYFFMEKSNLE